MAESLIIEGTSYTPAAAAGKHFVYTGAYMLMLARKGKIDAQKIGSRWYVNISSAENFFKGVEETRQVRNQEASVKRKAELRAFERLRKSTQTSRALVETAAILFIGLSIGAVGYLGIGTAQQASVSESESSFFHKLAVAFYSVFSSTEAKEIAIENGVLTESSSEAIVSEKDTFSPAVVIAPDEQLHSAAIESIRNSFSDEVEISVDPVHPDTGMIIPHFRNREGEAYRFLLVPLDAATSTAPREGGGSKQKPIETSGGVTDPPRVE